LVLLAKTIYILASFGERTSITLTVSALNENILYNKTTCLFQVLLEKRDARIRELEVENMELKSKLDKYQSIFSSVEGGPVSPGTCPFPDMGGYEVLI
jgi:hypothetical protein